MDFGLAHMDFGSDSHGLWVGPGWPLAELACALDETRAGFGSHPHAVWTELGRLWMAIAPTRGGIRRHLASGGMLPEACKDWIPAANPEAFGAGRDELRGPALSGHCVSSRWTGARRGLRRRVRGPRGARCCGRSGDWRRRKVGCCRRIHRKREPWWDPWHRGGSIGW